MADMKWKFLYALLALSIPAGASAQLVLTNTFAIPPYSYIWRRDLTNVIIPDTVTNVGISAFLGCTNLTNIVVGKGVNTIGIYAFATMSDDYEIWPLSNAVSVVFTGNAPTNVAFGAFDEGVRVGSLYPCVPCNVTVYFYAETSGWGALLDDRPAICLNPKFTEFAAFSSQYCLVHVQPLTSNMLVEASANLTDWSVICDDYSFYQGYHFFPMAGYPVRFFRISQPIPPYHPSFR